MLLVIMSRKNYYSSEIANTPDIVRAGFQMLQTEARRLGAQTVSLICNSKRDLDGLVGDVVGDKTVKLLRGGQSVRFTEDSVLEFYYRPKMPRADHNSPVLLCYPDAKLMGAVDELKQVPVLIVLPWVLENIRPWLMAYGAEDILGKADAVRADVSNPVVVAALKDILAGINRSTGVGHPDDKETVVGAFRILQDAGEEYDPTVVQAWLMRNGLPPRYAADIAEIAAEPKGFRLRSSARRWPPDILKKWRS